MNLKLAMLVLASITLVGTVCSHAKEQGPPAIIRGKAFYRERMAVPPGTQLEVVLEDISRADAPAVPIANEVVTNAGQPPYQFEILYSPGSIIVSHRYAVRARLTHEGRLLFTTDRIYPVITGGHPTEVELLMKGVPAPRTATAVMDKPPGVMPATFTGDLPCADCEAIHYHLDLFADRAFYLRTIYRGRPGGPFDDIGSWVLSSDGRIMVLQGGRETPLRFAIEGPDALRLMDRDGKPIVSKLNYTLRRAPGFSPIEPWLVMRGMYRYMADAALFTECLTGWKMPVATEGENRELEGAYLKTRREPGEELLVSLEGRIVQRMPMEGPGPVATLVPEKFIGVWPGETCRRRFSSADLMNTYWKLTRLGAAAALRFENQREPHIVLHGDNRLAGSDGCNLVTGTYRIDGNSIAFSQLASTMMACPKGMEQAQRFRKEIDAVARYRIVGQHLELLDGSGEMLLRFEAVELK